MGISQSALSMLYLYALLLGVGLGAVYDLLRISRVFLGVHYSRRAAKRLQQIKLPLLKPRRRRGESRMLGAVVFFEDLLFCLFAGIALILLFYAANNGKIRFPAFLCAAAGFLLYRVTIGRLVMLFSEVIAFVLECAVRYLVYFVSFPFVKLAGFVCRRAAIAAAYGVRAHQKALRRRFTEREIARMQRDACGLLPAEAAGQGRLKRGKRLGKGKKEAVQPNAFHARASGTADRGVHRDLCK